MATKQEVKQYLAYWFQLGKKVMRGNGKSCFLPKSIIEGDRYSQEFETAWQQIISQNSGDCYLEGTQETIAQLLTPTWEMSNCARCAMPIPMRNLGMPPELCPCSDLSNWPNSELPPPREPINSQEQLISIRDRLVNN